MEASDALFVSSMSELDKPEDQRRCTNRNPPYYCPGREDLLFTCECFFKDRTWFFWLYVSGKHEEAEKFTCEIIFFEKSTSRFIESRPLPVVSVEKSFKDIISVGPALKIPDTYVIEKLRFQGYWCMSIFTLLTQKI